MDAVTPVVTTAGTGDPGPADAARAGRAPVRMFMSYAHDDAEHRGRVRDFSGPGRPGTPGGSKAGIWRAWPARPCGL